MVVLFQVVRLLVEIGLKFVTKIIVDFGLLVCLLACNEALKLVTFT